MKIKRSLYLKLLEWKENPYKKPLILKGARQVGKTYLLKNFGETQYGDVAYFNFELQPKLKEFFEPDLHPQRILNVLSLYREKKIEQEKTLIIFDEVQEAPKVLTSLKYFQEQASNYHVISAGSLLGIQLGEDSSFPVGKVNFLNLYPLNFFEYLEAIEAHDLCNYVQNKKDFSSIETVFHEKLIVHLKNYFFLGGMPEVVSSYLQTQDINKVREIQREILLTYENDFSKHTTKTEALKIAMIWNSIPLQLAKENKKFKYAEIKKGGRAKEFETPLHWLKGAGLIHLSYQIKIPQLPLSGYADLSKFKVFVLDTGLLGALLRISPKSIVEGNELFSRYHGAFVENYVAQELVAQEKELYYWSRESQAEVDFVIGDGEKIYPLEVKAGMSHKKWSLKVYQEKYQPKNIALTTLKNFKQDGLVANYPLYAVSLFPKLSKG